MNWTEAIQYTGVVAALLFTCWDMRNRRREQKFQSYVASMGGFVELHKYLPIHLRFNLAKALNLDPKGSLLKLLTGAAMALLLAVTLHAQGTVNLVQNGSFEVGYSYSGWTLDSGGLLNLGGPGAGVQCADGYNAIGLSWQSTFYQDVPTVPGQQYDFNFYMAAWGPDFVRTNIVSLIPSFGSTSLGVVSFSGAGHTYQNMGWQKFDYTVTAAGTSSRISFFNPRPFSADPSLPMIDNVWLTPIPEPSAFTLAILSAAVILSKRRRTNRLH